MASRNTTDAKRFVRRIPNKKSEAYLVSTNEMTPRKTSETAQSTQQIISSSPIATNRSIETNSPRVDAPPARRVVVVRSPNNPNIHRGPVDLGDFGQSNATEKHKPVLSNGVNRS